MNHKGGCEGGGLLVHKGNVDQETPLWGSRLGGGGVNAHARCTRATKHITHGQHVCVYIE